MNFREIGEIGVSCLIYKGLRVALCRELPFAATVRGLAWARDVVILNRGTKWSKIRTKNEPKCR